jgi:hypothetical protein
MAWQPTLPRRPMLHDQDAKDAFEESTRFSLTAKAILAIGLLVIAISVVLFILSL